MMDPLACKGTTFGIYFPLIIFIFILYKLMLIAFVNPIRLIYFSRILLTKFFAHFVPQESHGIPQSTSTKCHRTDLLKLLYGLFRCQNFELKLF